MPERPYLIQRCELGVGKLVYDYMGSSEFEWGACPTALKRLFKAGLTKYTSSVVVAGNEVSVFMLAGADFGHEAYQPYLQQLADDKIRLKEWSHFSEALKQQLGIPLRWEREIRTNVWFDIQNDVLWTLSEVNQHSLMAALRGIQIAWDAKQTT